MNQAQRLRGGGSIDRGAPLPFAFDGRHYTGYRGDTLASALLANNVHLLGRSFKYHRPRGLVYAGVEEPNALVELRSGARREPNTKATTVELYSGLSATSQNCWPSVRWDVRALNQVFSPLLVAGFYYKTFMWPRSFWEKLYEPLIRRAAGLGRASGLEDPDTYEKRHAFCDVLVVGAGPTGLAAALAAARAGARVIVCEADFALGGRLLSEVASVNDVPAQTWVSQTEAELRNQPEVRILSRTTVFGAYDGGVFGAVERSAEVAEDPGPGPPRQRFWKIRARRAIVATGAIERPLVFAGNDRPGVMSASAIRTYLHRFATLPGRTAAVFTTTDDGWRTVRDLSASGAHVEVVVESRRSVHPELLEWATRSGVRVLLGAQVLETRGSAHLSRVIVRDATGKDSEYRVDLLGVSGGWNPQFSLASHLGAKSGWSDAIAAFVPAELPDGMEVVGAAAGDLALSRCLEQGAAAGMQAAEVCGHSMARAQAIARAAPEFSGVAPLWRMRETRGKAFVDFQNDVTLTDIELAVREGFRSVEHVKRYTTLGMATDQGKTSNANGHALTAQLTNQSIRETGSTTSRPPYTPVAIGALAAERRGTSFKPSRLTPGHEWAVERGAVFMDVGYWRRAHFFPKPSETSLHETVTREVGVTRSAVGVCDVSTLGKLDIQGPDAAALLDFVYANVFSTLPEGRVRYGLMLREDGFVMDDGTTARMGPNHYLMSTTTSNAALVQRHLDYCRQVLRPELDLQVTNVTEQWAQFSLAGPRSRELLQLLFEDCIDLSNEAFPYMAAAQVQVGALNARLFRISFSGELAYEIAVPAGYGDSLIRAIEAAGGPLGMTAYGLEALDIMRLEKGHVGGSELNGRTTADDLGLARMVSAAKDCVGKTLASRPALTAKDRHHLVGLRSVEPRKSFSSGALLLQRSGAGKRDSSDGYVTSAGLSPTLGSWIGLGLLREGRARMGEIIRAYDPVRTGEAELEVCSHHFLDPSGARLRV